MKDKSMILSVIAIVAVIILGILQIGGGCKNSKNTGAAVADSVSAAPGSIVYFNFDRVVNEYDYANELGDATEKKIKGITDEVTRRGNQLQNQINTFQNQVNKNELTSFQIQRKSQELQEKQQKFEEYYQQQQQIVAEERATTLNKIGNAIFEYIQKYNETKRFGLIITNQGNANVAAGDAGLDITDEIISGLNEEYVAKKAKGEIE